MFKPKICHVRKNSVYISWEVVFWRIIHHSSGTYILIAKCVGFSRSQAKLADCSPDMMSFASQKAKDSILPQKHVKHAAKTCQGDLKPWKDGRRFCWLQDLGNMAFQKREYVFTSDEMNEFDCSDCDVCRSKEQALEYYAGALLGVAQLQKLSRVGSRHCSIKQQ